MKTFVYRVANPPLALSLAASILASGALFDDVTTTDPPVVEMVELVKEPIVGPGYVQLPRR